MFVNITGERRVSNVKVNGEDLNLTRLYNISLDSFVGNGGDGYSMFTDLPVYYESMYTDTDSFMYYIRDNLKGEIPDEYRELQGRINIYNYSTSLPADYLMGFDNYKFSENSNLISFLTYIRLAKYSSDDIKNITMRVKLERNNLRLLQEETSVDCQKLKERELNIYIFNCSKNVDGPISKISYVENSIKLNGENLNLSSSETSKKIGENIQNQKNNIFDRENCVLKNCKAYSIINSLIIEGENDNEANLVSKDSNLLFVQDDEMKNVSCNISAGDTNKQYKIICKPNFIVNTDLSNNSFIVINDLNKVATLSFDKENSKANTTIEGDTNSYYRPYHKSSKGGLSGGTIVAIILPIIAAIAIVTALVFLLKNKSSPNISGAHRVPATSSPDIRV